MEWTQVSYSWFPPSAKIGPFASAHWRRATQAAMGDHTHVDLSRSPLSPLAWYNFVTFPLSSMLQGLENLNLAGNKITDAGMKVRTYNNHPSLLHTYYCWATAKLSLFQDFSKVQRSLRSLLQLNLSCNDFGTCVPPVYFLLFVTYSLNATRWYWHFAATIGRHILCISARAGYFFQLTRRSALLLQNTIIFFYSCT